MVRTSGAGHQPRVGTSHLQVGRRRGAEATSQGVSRAMTSAEAAPHRCGDPPGNSRVRSALWEDKRKAERLRTTLDGGPKKHSPSPPGGDPAGERNCLTTELRCFLGGSVGGHEGQNQLPGNPHTGPGASLKPKPWWAQQ